MRESKPKPKRRTRGLSKIKKTEIARVARALKAAELPLRGVEVDPLTGKFTMLIGEPGETSNDLDQWLGRKKNVLTT